MSIFLVLEMSNKVEVWADFEFTIKDKDHKEIKTVKSKKPCIFVQGTNWGFNKFINRDFLLDESNGLTSNNKFWMICKIIVYPKYNYWSKSLEYEIPESHFLNNLWSMFENQKFCDVTLIVCNKEFKAHKTILAAQSPVFFAMFEYEMEESRLNQVTIPDIDPSVFEELMCFMYTGKSPNLEVMAEDLLVAADKYQLERLKAMCGKALCEKLALNNVFRILVLADIYSVNKLKTYAINFVISLSEVALKAEDFQLIKTLHPNLFAEIWPIIAAKLAPQDDKDQDPVQCRLLPVKIIDNPNHGPDEQ